jgi:hypothetical protein
VWSESGAVSSFILDPKTALFTPDGVLQLSEAVIEAHLITLLLHRSADHRPDQGIVSFKGIGEMVRHLRSHRAIHQRRSERLVATADVTIPEPAERDRLGSSQALGRAPG